MNFQARLLIDELLTHDKIYSAQEEISSGIHIVPWQSCIPFMFGDDRPITLQGHCFLAECYMKFK